MKFIGFFSKNSAFLSFKVNWCLFNILMLKYLVNFRCNLTDIIKLKIVKIQMNTAFYKLLPFFSPHHNTIKHSDTQAPINNIRPVVKLPPDVILRLSESRIVCHCQLLQIGQSDQMTDFGQVTNSVVVQGQGPQGSARQVAIA